MEGTAWAMPESQALRGPEGLCPQKASQDAEGPPGARVRPEVTGRPVGQRRPAAPRLTPAAQWVTRPCGGAQPAPPPLPWAPFAPGLEVREVDSSRGRSRPSQTLTSHSRALSPTRRSRPWSSSALAGPAGNPRCKNAGDAPAMRTRPRRGPGGDCTLAPS